MGRQIMNNAADINKRAQEIHPLSLFGASATVFPDKISPVRTIMAVRHASQRVVLTNPEFPGVFAGAENPFGERSSWDIVMKDDYELVKVFKKFKSYDNSVCCYILRNRHTGKYKCEMYYPAINLTEK